MSSSVEQDALVVLNRHFESEGESSETSVMSAWIVGRHLDAVTFVPATGRSNWVFLVRADRVGGYSPMHGSIDEAYRELLDA